MYWCVPELKTHYFRFIYQKSAGSTQVLHTHYYLDFSQNKGSFLRGGTFSKGWVVCEGRYSEVVCTLSSIATVANYNFQVASSF